MKRLLILLALIPVLILAACSDFGLKGDEFNPAAEDAATKVTVSAIAGVTPPAMGETPVTTITATDQYTGTVTWSDSPVTFAASTVYTATITLTAKSGYTLTGVAADFFTVTGATSDTNPADSGVVTAVFPATGAVPPTVINIAAIVGVTVPVYNATPVTTITATDQYTGTVTWSDSPVTFAPSTTYTATITLTAKSGYTLTGVAADFFTVAGTTSETNPINSGVITAVFPATDTIFVMSGTGGTAGNNQSFTKGTLIFNMKYVPGGTFPTGTDDLGGNQTISTPYWMSETEMTYELWNAVRTWATTTGGYTFANAGVQGDSGAGTNQHPVTTINWRDSMVWCNALTEYYNANNGTDTDLDCVYYTNATYSTPIRVSTNDTTDTTPADGILDNSLVAGSEDYPYIKAAANGNTDISNCTAKGFRLSGSMEWECAARYKNGSDWTAGSMATGGTVAWTGTAATDYPNFSPFAWYGNSTVSPTGNTTTTQPVAGKTANALGIRDMSGNVWEWCFDWHPSVGDLRVIRGGSWFLDADYLRVGGVHGDHPYTGNNLIGFRFVRTQ